MTKFILLLAGCISFVTVTFSQSYSIRIPQGTAPDVLNTLPFSGMSPDGTSLSVNNRYFIRNGKPWYPVMGELHYNRIPPAQWVSTIRKMKASGISIVATYVFWNEHELQPGQFTWDQRKDLQEFLRLCKQEDMLVWLRIGPWCHGEQLYGGHPSWINSMNGKRSNHPAYIKEVTAWFNQIGKQTTAAFFSEGGPIIGVQIENEYAQGDSTHVHKLKEIANKAGIRPVYWTITANTVFQDRLMEFIPLQGAYPYRGWEPNGGKATKDFLYANDQWIMSDALGKLYYDVELFPRGLCEQGCGSQMTYANRFVVEPEVVEAHLQNQIGRGMNLIGYYMFAGGTQSPGLKEPGYPESYDFQAPVAEFGWLRKSYHHLTTLHHFLRDFGSELAPMRVIRPANPVQDELDTAGLRYVVREQDQSGFVFLCNTQVRVPMPNKLVQLSLQLDSETIRFPDFIVKGETAPILPFNMKLGNQLLKFATAQPLAKLENQKRTTIVFVALPGVVPTFQMEYPKTREKQVFMLEPGSSKVLPAENGIQLEFVVISKEDALQSWRYNKGGKQYLFISSANPEQVPNGLEWYSTGSPSFSFRVFPAGLIKKALLNRRQFRFGFNKGGDLLTASVTPYSPGIKIDSSLLNQWSFKAPAQVPLQVADIHASATYSGTSARLLSADSLVSDHLANGLNWKFSLQYVKAGKTSSLQAADKGRINSLYFDPVYRLPLFFKHD